MAVENGHAGGDMALAFSLAAVRELGDPGAVFADARTWSHHVGIIDDDHAAIDRTVAEHGLDQDFDLGNDDKWLALERIREGTPGPRHVYVGATERDQRAATQVGWEYLHVGEAADKADWDLAPESEEAGLLDRLAGWLLGRRDS